MDISKNSHEAVLVVIPARGGSKGIPRKNLSFIHGKTLAEWAIVAALQIKFEKRIVLSSDSDEILQVSRNYSEVVTSKRPAKLSQDYIADYQVLRHELARAELLNSVKFDCVVMLQPTSPIRNPSTLNTCVEAVLELGHSSAWTVSPIPLKYHARKQLVLNDGVLKFALESPLVVARQELDSAFIRNGICYAISRETLLSDEKLLGEKALPVFCDWPSVNIDEVQDLELAQTVSKNINGFLIPSGEIK
jgi:CMP-N-acetylneuraminic acid synthetase